MTFTYDPEGEAVTPDTALPVGTGSPAAPMGVLSIVLAVTLPVAVRG